MVAARKLQELQHTKASNNIVQEDTARTRSDVVLRRLFAAKPWNLLASICELANECLQRL